MGHSQLRIDCHTQMQVLFQESDLTVVNRISDPRNGVLCPQSLRQQTAQHIQLVCGCTGNDQVSVRHVRLLLHLHIRAVAGDTENVHAVQSFLQLPRVLVDQYDIIILFRQLGAQLMPHLSVANDNYLHLFIPLFPIFSLEPLYIPIYSNRIIALLYLLCNTETGMKRAAYITKKCMPPRSLFVLFSHLHFIYDFAEKHL